MFKVRCYCICTIAAIQIKGITTHGVKPRHYLCIHGISRYLKKEKDSTNVGKDVWMALT